MNVATLKIAVDMLGATEGTIYHKAALDTFHTMVSAYDAENNGIVLTQEEIHMCQNGYRIDAVRLVRERYGCRLIVAKKATDEYYVPSAPRRHWDGR